MHTIYMGGKMQYIGIMSPLNPHYVWERVMQYLHDNLNIYTIYMGDTM
jgi:hypothetical protein